MQITIKEVQQILKNGSEFMIIINQKKAVKLEKGKKRTLILNKPTKIKVQYFFLESNEIEVTKSCFLEIHLNIRQLIIKLLAIGILIYCVVFICNPFLKILSIFLAGLLFLKLKKNWYRLIVVESKMEGSSFFC